jgi:hypothetical protein
MRLIDADLIDEQELYNCESVLEAIDYIMEQPTVNTWIPCSERLPEDLNDKNTDCFLVTDGFLIWMAYYNSEIGWQFAECTNSRNKIDWTEIIAWMPLPSPYTENRKES